MPIVEFRNIAKKYGVSTVLESLNLKIDNGEFVVLLGPSGCGKTTLLNILAGLLEADNGEIYIGEREVSNLDPKDRGLAMVFQSYALYPTKSVRGNLKFGLSARKLSSEQMEQRINWAAKLLHIDHLLDRKPSQLSGGQRQRVAIGRCLVKQVDLFLFDEPLSNLDAKLRTEMRIEIKKLHNQLQNTVIYVTHDQVEAMTMATKYLRMERPAQFFEKAGRDAIAFLDLPSRTIMARVDPPYADRYRHEKSVPLLLPLNRLSVFDAESGRRL
ncbi:MAG TPA: ABC transporter ATP-binding protein [Chthoniobacterales bacterium]|nr:ABC transporter ATP-binding protein [Chthoniobacterales bacterium]